MKKLAFAAPLVALALAGCAHDPTIAGRVGKQTISISDVDLLARVACLSAAHSSTPLDLSLPTANQAAVNLLIETDLAARTAALTHVALSQQDEQQLAEYSTGLQSLVALLPAQDRSQALELLVNNGRGQLQMEEIAVKVLENAGQQPTQDTVVLETEKLTAVAANQFGVQLNPRFGSYSPSAQGSGSLSDAVSAVAKASQSAPTSSGAAAYVRGLPATQRCS